MKRDKDAAELAWKMFEKTGNVSYYPEHISESVFIQAENISAHSSPSKVSALTASAIRWQGLNL